MAQFIPFGDAGLFDEFVQNLDVAAFETPLLRVGKLVEWELFEREILASTLRVPKAPGGRPRFAPMLMFKVLVLQSLHGLADDATAFQITDRHSFRAFLGLTPGEAVPDGQTIADFRAALVAAGSFERLFAAFPGHLQQRHGLALAKAGVMVDATFVEVPRQRNTRGQNAQIKAGEIPPACAEDAKWRAHKDTDARWAMKDFTPHFGYKNHCKVDVADKLILAATVTAAHVHDSREFPGLVKAGDGSMHADSAYQSARTEADLAAKGVTAHLNERGSKTRPLDDAQKEANRERSRVRSRAEHVFAQMRGSMRALWQRCIGQARNAAGIVLTNLVYDMMRLEQIVRLRIVYPAAARACSRPSNRRAPANRSQTPLSARRAPGFSTPHRRPPAFRAEFFPASPNQSNTPGVSGSAPKSKVPADFGLKSKLLGGHALRIRR